MWKRVTSLSASYYILNVCVLLVLRLFMMKYCFFNHVEETFKLSVNLLISACQFLPGGLIVMMFWTGLGLNKWTKSFTIVNKYFIYTYVQFLLTKRAFDDRLCIIFLALTKLVTPGFLNFISDYLFNNVQIVLNPKVKHWVFMCEDTQQLNGRLKVSSSLYILLHLET